MFCAEVRSRDIRLVPTAYSFARFSSAGRTGRFFKSSNAERINRRDLSTFRCSSPSERLSMPGVVEARGMRAHRVAETPLFTQFLEQPGTGVAAEDDMQDLHRVAPRIVVARSGKTQRELSLLDVASLGGDARPTGIVRAPSHSESAFAKESFRAVSRRISTTSSWRIFPAAEMTVLPA